MTVIVDTREPDDLASTIGEFADEVKRETLKTGDFLVRDRIIERKEYGDFLGRLTDTENGIWMQLMRMTEAAEEQDLTPVLLLEGDAEAALRWGDVGMHELVSAIGGVHKMDVSLVTVPDERATAQFLASLETSQTEGSVHKIRDTPSVPEEYMPAYLAQGFERIGAKGGKRLLEEFGTFKAIVDAEPEELEEVHGIGPSTAEKIYEHCRMEMDLSEYP